MRKKLYLFIFLFLFLVSLSSFYIYNYYEIENVTCSPREGVVKSRKFYIGALTSSGSVYKEGNKTFDFTGGGNALIAIKKDPNGQYVISLAVDNITLIREKATSSDAKLLVFNGLHRGKFEQVGDNFFVWLKPCYNSMIMKKLGLIPTPKYLGEDVSFSFKKYYKVLESSIDMYINGSNNYSIVHRKWHVVKSVLFAEGPSFNITFHEGLSNKDEYEVSWYNGVFLACGVPISLSLIVPAKYVNMTGLESLVGYKPEHGEYIGYYQISWDANWSQVEHARCNRPFFFSDTQVVVLSLVAGLIGVLVVWVFKRGG